MPRVQLGRGIQYLDNMRVLPWCCADYTEVYQHSTGSDDVSILRIIDEISLPRGNTNFR